MNNRLFFLDNLKVALVCLVVVHHAGQPYGGSGGFWYFQVYERTINLRAFFAVNASFFMSLFFFISAYFVPASFDKKGPALFLKDRFVRLAPPLLAGGLIMIPLLMYAYFINFRGYKSISFWNYYINIYLGFGMKPKGWTGPSWPDLQFAHLWFIEHLLIYAVLYCAIRWLLKKRISKKLELNTLSVIMFGVLVASATFAIRIQHPINEWVGFLGFIQTEFAHVPQYAAFFIAGTLAYRNRWLDSISNAAGLGWLSAGVILMLLRYGGWVPFLSPGGLNRDSLGYSFYETFLCLGLSIGLLYIFRELGNRTNSMARMLARHAFAVYFVHVPVVVGLQYALAHAPLPTGLKFVLAAAGGIVLSFLISCGAHQLMRGARSTSRSTP
nr:acyltransferase family protein [Paenibacillus forsythiae]